MKGVVLANVEGAPGVQTSVNAVLHGKSALEAIEEGIKIVELDGSIRTVGFGGAPNILGEMECDASIMCGETLRTGAVGALKEYVHVISVAREVMERTPHVMLVGEGAALFAKEIGARKGQYLSDEARTDYEKWIEEHVPPELKQQWPNVPLSALVWPSARPDIARGTTCFLVRARDGNWGGGVSTSGWAYKYPGRLGDSPIIGAGMYVDNRYGAAACTNTGEMTIRAGTARAVIAYLKKGAKVEEACYEAVEDLKALKGGYLGSVIIHAMNKEGDVCVVGFGLNGTRSYWYWRDGMEKAETRSVLLVT